MCYGKTVEVPGRGKGKHKRDMAVATDALENELYFYTLYRNV